MEDLMKPEILTNAEPQQITELDVREDLRSGNDPFKKIMAAVEGLGAGDILVIRNIIEPVPLYMVLGNKGLAHWTEKLADDDWKIYFFKDQAAAGEQEAASGGGQAAASAVGAASQVTEVGEGLGDIVRSNNVITIDVRNLEPPLPFQKTMELVHSLQPGEILVQLNDRYPQLLFPKLDTLGLTYEVEEYDGLFKTVIKK